MKFKKLFSFTVGVFCLVYALPVSSALETNISKTVNEKYSKIFKTPSGEVVKLRKTTSKDLSALTEMITENDLTRFLSNGTGIINIDELVSLDSNNINLIIENKDKKIVGQVSLTDGCDKNIINVCYWVDKNFRGKGYSFQAVKNAMNKIWETDKTVQFEFWIDNENIASIKTLKKISENFNIDFENPSVLKGNCQLLKYGPHVFETKAKQNRKNLKEYIVDMYFNGDIICTYTATKEQLLMLYPKEKIDNCANATVARSTNTYYLIKHI